jgi:hypothetical protein
LAWAPWGRATPSAPPGKPSPCRRAGTTATFTQSISDWFTQQGYAGETTALSTAYRDTSVGTEQAGPFNVYEYTWALDPTKTVSSLTLPEDGNVEVLAIDVLR